MGDEEIRLSLWSEAIGPFGGCFTDNHFIYLKINEKLLTFPKESKEAELIVKKLGQCPLGTKIGILKSDVQGNPLFIRLIGKASEELARKPPRR